ncbi:hypothetical protein LINPERPRIM_LOCUS16841 [Linum perenne]
MVCKVKGYGVGYVVDLRNRACSCGYYSLSGISCLHAVAAILFLHLKVEEYVHDLYKTSHVATAYGQGIPSIVGCQAWPQAIGYDILPPIGRRMLG